MKEKKTNKAAVISLIILFVLSAIYLITPMIGGYNWYGWILAILNLIAGPAVLIAYPVSYTHLRESRTLPFF